MDLKSLSERLIHNAGWDPAFSDIRIFEAKAPSYSETIPSFSQAAENLLDRQDIHRLYSHQEDALRKLRQNKNVLLATPTASGKSLTYQLPVIDAISADPKSSSLLIFPFKALARDQARLFKDEQLFFMPALQRPFAGVYDGDTPQVERKKMRRNPPHVLITNPDMIHYSLLPYHTRWHAFLKSVDFVVIDEIHVYRGVFGSQVLQTFRRLKRVLQHYGASPRFIMCSATIGNPEELAERLIEESVDLVTESGAPVEAKGFISHFPASKASTAAVHMLEACVNNGLKTIVFTKSRRSTELIYRYVCSRRPELEDRLAIYRAGFLPEHRRSIEQKLFRDELSGVISTSALEHGIDIGGLDCCILVGFPGSVASLWQRAGRVGRKSQPSLVVYIAGEDALDRYWYEHAEKLYASPVEKAIVYEHNDEITDMHLECAADEIILNPGGNYPDSPHIRERITALVQSGQLLESARGGEYVCRESMPQRRVAIRSVGDSYEIVDIEGRKIGHVDGIRVFKECHEGAVYLHGGEVFRVRELDRDNFRVLVTSGPDDVYTQAMTSKETDILDIAGDQTVGKIRVQHGRLRVRERVTGYRTRRIYSGEIVSRTDLDFPEMVFETRGLWMNFPDWMIEALKRKDLHPMGGLHALEHAMIGLYPLVSLCDRNDLAGISTQSHAQTGGAAVFIYDGFPGGLGLAESALDRFDDLLKATLDHVVSCPCDSGCPWCIQSPKCGSGNEPLDKAATVFLMRAAAGTIPALPFPVPERVPEVEVKDMSRFMIPELPEPADCMPGHELVFDIETQLSADDVGGWRNAHKMRIAICVVLDIEADRFEFYRESDADRLIDRLAGASRVIGYNSEGFDFNVLRGYASRQRIAEFKSLDLMQEIIRNLGHRTGLNTVAAATVQAEKTADGLQSLKWWKEGRLDRIAEYCRKDVEITNQVYQFGRANGHVLHPHRSGQLIRVPVNW